MKQPTYVLITGVAGGIGKALVNTFKHSGYVVIGVDCVPCPEQLRIDYYIQADLAQTVTDEAYAEKIFSEIRNNIGQGSLKALINNAAVQILGKSDDLTRKDWQQTLDVNLMAPFLWTQAFLSELELAKGSVVNISSIHARLTKKNFVAYATSKAALSGMTQAMAVDLGSRVRVNAIEPAAIETDMLKAGFVGKPGMYQQLKSCHPQNSIGQPDEVAKLAIAIVDGGMNFINSACVCIDGGISARLFDPS